MSNYPNLFDDDSDLYVVRDAVRFNLVNDYNPGDRTITVTGNTTLWSTLPSTGIVTLTDPCSDLDDRAVSYSYVIDTTITTSMVLVINDSTVNAAILPGFTDVVKPKRLTHVTMNVMSDHHNQIKNAIIAIENFIGVQGTVDFTPLGTTMEGRINFLRKLVLSPKAYFTADRMVGLVPLTVNFQDLSFRLGTDGTTGTIMYHWDFGDGTISEIVSNISVITNPVIADCESHELIEITQFGAQVGTQIQKTYCEPGIFDVTLTVSNNFGTDTIVLSQLIHARVEAPDAATIEFIPNATTQLVTTITPIPTDSCPNVSGNSQKIRSPINTLIAIDVPSGESISNPGFSYAGEPLSGSTPIDPIVTYTWKLSDDLTHSALSSATKASYSVGGLYDVVLRVDTTFGSFRITTFEDSIDIVEKQNLWMFLTDTTGTIATPYEFGLISNSFKVGPTTLTVARDDSFLANLNFGVAQQAEFNRNVGFTPLGTTASGNGGNALVFYASGRGVSDSPMNETVQFWNFNGFAQTFQTVSPISRTWNWANFNSPTHSYFLLGEPTTANAPFTSLVNTTLTDYNLGSSTASNASWTAGNFLNGADDLLTNGGYLGGTNFDDTGISLYGDYSVYRTAWSGNQGFLLRNDAAGAFFRIRSFYGTVGTMGTPVASIGKLQDMPGPSKLEGELVNLTSGLCFFNNTGAISVYDPTTSTWATGGPGVNSDSFRSLQDQTVQNYDDASNTLLCASDGDNRAFLSYDYSFNAFIQFNNINLTFSKLPSRPVGGQFLMGVY